MAGHSKWANIKHKKARADAKRGKLWSKCARAIIVAAKNGGGDPASNLALRYAIEEARAANMPKDTIENAIKKGTGELAAESYESVIYEGYGPGGVAIMLDILTDNRNRTAPEIRKIFEKYGGNLGGSGCVAYLFQNKGQIFVGKQGPGASEEAVMTVALEAGAEDITDEGETWQVLTEPAQLIPVREALEQAGMTLESAQLTMVPSTTVSCTGSEAQRLLELVDALEDHDDVQKVYANFEIPDEELAALEK
ncbi:MAG TPA: YebC/PmpR family DNA-binding transcriptional regulator [Phycisphaeraceae bacterium]